MDVFDYSADERVSKLVSTLSALYEIERPLPILESIVQGVSPVVGPRAYLRIATKGLPSGAYRITGFQTDDGTAQVPRADWGASIESLPVHRGGLIGELAAARAACVIREIEWPSDEAFRDVLLPYRSLMAVPVFAHHEPVDTLIVLSTDPEAFDADTLLDTLLRTCFISLALDSRYTNLLLIEAQRRISDEVNQIAGMHKAFLDATTDRLPGLDIAAHHCAADRAGGDYYLAIPAPAPLLAGGRWSRSTSLIVMADAAGHGPAAAMLISMLHAMLYTLPNGLGGPGEVLAHLNDRFLEWRMSCALITAVCALYDPETRRLTWARAGHEVPLIRRAEDSAFSLADAEGGIPLGVLPTEYADQHLDLEPGDTIILYTDGITEKRDARDAFYGVEGIINSLDGASGTPAQLLERLLADVHRYGAGLERKDDETILVCGFDV